MLKVPDFASLTKRLSKKERTILTVALTVVGVVVLDRLVVYPVFDRMRSLDETIAIKEAEVRKDLRIVAQKEKIVSESARYGAYIGGGKEEEAEFTQLLQEVEAIANKSGVYLADMKPAGTKSVGTSKRFMVTLNCEADMDKLIDFLYQVEKSHKLLTVEKYTITPKSKDTVIARCSMTVSKITIP